jgi:23S rRNA pseudouridine1911/1915/1917 synthase
MHRAYQFQIEESDARLRLNEFLASRFGGLSRMRIANLIEAGACVVNGTTGRAGYRLAAGDSIDFSFDDGPPTSMFPESIPLEIVYEDDDLVVVVKPAGMLAHPTMYVKSGTLANALAYHLNRSTLDHQLAIRPGLVHRLDRATSGLMVVAKTSKALATVSRHFRKRLVEKRYCALVHGIVTEETGSIIAPIGRDQNQQPRWRVMESGKPAETRFTVLERFEEATLLELEPITGRTNQLRIHCAHLGHPIVGDEMHQNCGLRISDCGIGAEKSIEPQFAIRNPQSAIRLCLHAWKLALHHPANGEWREFRSPMPADVLAIVERWRRSD